MTKTGICMAMHTFIFIYMSSYDFLVLVLLNLKIVWCSINAPHTFPPQNKWPDSIAETQKEQMSGYPSWTSLWAENEGEREKHIWFWDFLSRKSFFPFPSAFLKSGFLVGNKGRGREGRSHLFCAQWLAGSPMALRIMCQSLAWPPPQRLWPWCVRAASTLELRTLLLGLC